MKFKIVPLALLALLSIGVTSCNTPSTSESESTVESVETQTEWSEAEQQLLETFFGDFCEAVNLPYHYIEGNLALSYDAEYDCLSLTGAQTTSGEPLKAYAQKFDAGSWDFIAGFEEIGGFMYGKEIVREDATMLVEVDMYTLDANNEVAFDGVGTFWMDVYCDVYIEGVEYGPDLDKIMSDILVNLGVDTPTLNEDYSESTWYDVPCLTADVLFGELVENFVSEAEAALTTVIDALEEGVVQLTAIQDASSGVGEIFGDQVIGATFVGQEYDYGVILFGYLNEGQISVQIIVQAI